MRKGSPKKERYIFILAGSVKNKSSILQLVFIMPNGIQIIVKCNS